MEHPRRSCAGGRCRRRRGAAAAAAAAANIWQRRATRELFQAAGLLIRHKLCKERLLTATTVCSPPAAAARSNLVRHAVRAGSVRSRLTHNREMGVRARAGEEQDKCTVAATPSRPTTAHRRQGNNANT